jgi:uncharacterized protein (TIGR01777 family)
MFASKDRQRPCGALYRASEWMDGMSLSVHGDFKMKVLIAGAGGLIGSAAASYLSEQGNEVVRLVRRAAGSGEVRWDPDGRAIDAAGVEGFDAVVHVASMSWNGRWTPAFKQRIRENHVGTIQLITEALTHCHRKPAVLICASGMGIYPPSGDQWITEDTPFGTDFLARLQCDGEAAANPATAAGIRVVHLRIPMVLGGANLAMLAANARRGFGRLGSGRQWCSWVSRNELANMIHFGLICPAVSGPINAVSPNPVTNAEFSETLARVLGCKSRMAIPAFLLRLMLGEMADALALASRRMQPCKLLAAGYQFHFPDIEGALRHELELVGEG